MLTQGHHYEAEFHPGLWCSISPGFVGMVVQLGFLSSCVHFLFWLSGCQVTVYYCQFFLPSWVPSFTEDAESKLVRCIRTVFRTPLNALVIPVPGRELTGCSSFSPDFVCFCILLRARCLSFKGLECCRHFEINFLGGSFIPFPFLFIF